MIECAVFDLDGTLLNTLGDLCAAVNFAMLGMKQNRHTEEEVRAMIGDGVAKLIERALPNDAKQLAPQALERFRSYYETHINVHTMPYPGIENLLRRLRSKGIRTAILTNKNESAALLLAEKFFPKLFDIVRGGRTGVRLKPHPDALTDMLSTLNVAPQNAAMVGDSSNDMYTAAGAGVHGIGVSWGYRREEELFDSGAERVAKDAEELYTFLLSV